MLVAGTGSTNAVTVANASTVGSPVMRSHEVELVVSNSPRRGSAMSERMVTVIPRSMLRTRRQNSAQVAIAVPTVFPSSSSSPVAGLMYHAACVSQAALARRKTHCPLPEKVSTATALGVATDVRSS